VLSLTHGSANKDPYVPLLLRLVTRLYTRSVNAAVYLILTGRLAATLN